jgi:hypothetical protein
MTDKFLTELDEALTEFHQIETDFEGELHWPDKQVYEAATMLRDLYPLLVQLCEARKQANPAKWWHERGIRTEEMFLSMDGPDGMFAVCAANLTTQIQKILEGE